MQKRHSICRNVKCIWCALQKQVSVRSYWGAESPVVTRSVWHTRDHRSVPLLPGDWPLGPASQLSELVVLICNGSWVVTAEKH